MDDHAYLKCINPDCGATYPADQVPVACGECGCLLDVRYDWAQVRQPSWELFERRWMTKGEHGDGRLDFSGVWRFRELLPFFRDEREIITIGEGRTNLQDARRLARQVGLKPGNVHLQYEGLNPTGSFKDNGMTAAFSHARMVGTDKVACASTGNTSASLALFADMSGMKSIVFIGSGKIAYGKLSQALDYGARTLQIIGDFDACLRRVRQLATQVPELGIYLMNSVNPFRLEGQKAIMYRILEARDWQVPDWVLVPGGNLGNSAAFGKAFEELYDLGLIDRIPRLGIIQATGANTLETLYNDHGVRWNGGRWNHAARDTLYEKHEETGQRAKTIASAIEIAHPVNLPKAFRSLEVTDGVVRAVDDEAILEHKALVGRYGFGCEPASAASVAGMRLLVDEGVIDRDADVVCILTGHQLKDPDATVRYHTGIDTTAVQSMAPQAEPTGRLANRPVPVRDDLRAIVEALGGDPALVEAHQSEV